MNGKNVEPRDADHARSVESPFEPMLFERGSGHRMVDEEQWRRRGSLRQATRPSTEQVASRRAARTGGC